MPLLPHRLVRRAPPEHPRWAGPVPCVQERILAVAELEGLGMKSPSAFFAARSTAQWLLDAIDRIAELHPEIRTDPTVHDCLQKAATGELHPRCAENDARRQETGSY